MAGVRALLAACALFACGGQADPGAGTEVDTAHRAPTPVLLVSIDGFRHDYPDRGLTPHLDRLIGAGVRADRLVPVFPTKTFPNQYTLVTGLHPDRHGIVSNSFWDPVFGQRFSMYDKETVQEGRWWGGTPVWVTAELRKLPTAPYFWPGSEAEIGGIRPSHWMPYDGSVSNAARVHKILELLDLPPAQRPVFLTLYFTDTDAAGHRHGPDSDEVDAAIAAVDQALGLLLDGLAARGVQDEVNVIVVSDHGMTSTSSDQVIFVEDYIDLADVHISDWSPVLALWPKSGRTDAVFAGLQERHPRLHVYRKADFPERWHYGSHRRIPPLLAVAEPGWSITTREHFAQDPGRYDGGSHGFDPEEGEMAGIFIARGPGFRSRFRAEALSAVHVYRLIMHLLRLPPEPSDGRLEAVSHLLAP